MLLALQRTSSNKSIALASGSPRRKEILEQLGLQFTIELPNVPENLEPSDYKSISSYTEALAKLKADAVLRLVKDKYDILIAADTVVTYQGQIFGKPKDRSDAIQILEKLSGQSHNVITGVCIYDSSTSEANLFSECTLVKMAKLSYDIIKAYVASGEPMDKAGAYGIQGLGGSLIERIEGDYYNVMGLPMHRLCQHLLMHL